MFCCWAVWRMCNLSVVRMVDGFGIGDKGADPESGLVLPKLKKPNGKPILFAFVGSLTV